MNLCACRNEVDGHSCNYQGTNGAKHQLIRYDMISTASWWCPSICVLIVAVIYINIKKVTASYSKLPLPCSFTCHKSTSASCISNYQMQLRYANIHNIFMYCIFNLILWHCCIARHFLQAQMSKMQLLQLETLYTVEWDQCGFFVCTLCNSWWHNFYL